MQLNLGYDTTNNAGVIQPGLATVNFTNLLLNPLGGNVGIGTITPTAKLMVIGSTDGIYGQGTGRGVWGYSDNGNGVKGESPTGYAGAFFGKVQVTGTLEALNMPGVEFGQTFCQSPDCIITVSGNSSYTADTITVDVPAPGFLFISAYADISIVSTTPQLVEFNLYQCSDVNCNSATQLTESAVKAAEASAHLSWVIQVSTAGPVTLRTNGVSHNSGTVNINSHNLSAIYLPKQYRASSR